MVILRRVLRASKFAWEALSRVSGIVGVLLVWSSIWALWSSLHRVFVHLGLGDPTWGQLVLVLVTLQTIYIVWIDVRPHMLKWWHQSQKRPLAIISGAKLPRECFSYRDPKKTDYLYELICSFAVTNNTERTLRNVQASLLTVRGLQTLVLKETGADTVDTQPGMIAIFDVGTLTFPTNEWCKATPRETIDLSQEEFDEKELVARHTRFSLMGNSRQSFGGRASDESPDPVFGLKLWISADDTKPLVAEVEIGPEDAVTPFRIVGLQSRSNGQLTPSQTDQLDQPHEASINLIS